MLSRKQWIALGAAVLAAAVTVTAALLLRKPPLVSAGGVESVVVSVHGLGHKELVYPDQQKDVLKLVNGMRREEVSDIGDIYGWHIGVYVYYDDGTRETLWFSDADRPYTTDVAGVSFPAGEYVSLYQGEFYHVEDGTLDTLRTFCDGIDGEYTVGVLPEERMQQAGLIQE